MMTVDAIAQKYGVDGQTVRHWIVSKQLAAVDVCRRPGGKKPRWRIDEDDLNAFLATRGNRPATQQAQAAKPRQKTATTGKQWV